MNRVDELLYSTTDSNLRLARFRSIIENGICDAILLVAGPDSKENPGCCKAFNYLLLGHSGWCQLDSELGSEELEEVMIVIHKGGVIIYSTPSIVRRLLPLVAMWANVDLICLDERTFRDQDYFEEHKIASFKSMVSSFSTIGIPLSGADPKKIVERWPIIQAYAYDEKGMRKFFTMEHAVVDISTLLEPVYRMIDGHTLSAAILQNLDQFSRHWNGTLANVDTYFRPPSTTGGSHYKLEPIPEMREFIREPLTTYFEYSSIRREQILKELAIKKPQILFGVETSMESNCTGSSDNTHFTVEAHDPQSGLWSARTYFLSTGHLGSSMGMDLATVDMDKYNDMAQDIRWLITLYHALVRGVRVIAEKLMAGILKPSPKKFFETIVQTVLTEQRVTCPPNFDLLGKVHGVIRQFPPFSSKNTAGAAGGAAAAGFSSSFEPNAKEPTLIHIGLKMTEICSIRHPTTVIGGLSYGETVVCPSSSNLLLNLTFRNIPTFEAWAVTPIELKRQATFKKVVNGLLQQAKVKSEDSTKVPPKEDFISKAAGNFLVAWEEDAGLRFTLPNVTEPGESASATLGFQEKYISVGEQAFVFEYGLLLYHKRVGYFDLLTWNKENPNACPVDHITLYDPASLRAPILLVIHYKKADYCPCYALDYFQGSETLGSIVLCFSIHSLSKRTFLSDILHLWKATWKELGIPLAVENEIPTELLDHCPLIKDHIDDLDRRIALKDLTPSEVDVSVENTLRSSVANLAAQFPEMETMCNYLHQDATKSLHRRPESFWVPSPVREQNDNFNPSIISVHLLNGIPGSGKHRLATEIRHYIQTHHPANLVDIHIIASTLEEGITFQKNRFITKVKQLRKSFLASLAVKRKVIILVITPGFTTVPMMYSQLLEILSTDLRTSPTDSESLEFKLESSITLINTDNFFENHLAKPPFQLMPHVLDQCTQGFVTAILLEANTSTVNVGQVERLLQDCNSSTVVVYTRLALISHMGLGIGFPGSDDERREDCILHSAAMQQARLAAMPDPYLISSGRLTIGSIYLTIPSFPVSYHQLVEWMNKICDPKQVEFMFVLAKLYVEGYAREVRLISAKGYRSMISKPTAVTEVKQEQQFFIIGRDLVESEVISKLKLCLTSGQSVMKSILNIEGRGEFTPKLHRPLLTRDCLVDEDIQYILNLHRETPLPENCYYDGVWYINEVGKRSKIRPDAEVIISHWIDEQNTTIMKENNTLLA